jgi:hypothetical protein
LEKREGGNPTCSPMLRPVPGPYCSHPAYSRRRLAEHLHSELRWKLRRVWQVGEVSRLQTLSLVRAEGHRAQRAEESSDGWLDPIIGALISIPNAQVGWPASTYSPSCTSSSKPDWADKTRSTCEPKRIHADPLSERTILTFNKVVPRLAECFLILPCQVGIDVCTWGFPSLYFLNINKNQFTI